MQTKGLMKARDAEQQPSGVTYAVWSDYGWLSALIVSEADGRGESLCSALFSSPIWNVGQQSEKTDSEAIGHCSMLSVDSKQALLA